MEAENSRGGASRSPDVGLKNKCVTLEEGEPARQDRGVVDPGLGSGTGGTLRKTLCFREVTGSMAQPQVESGKKGSGQEVQCGSFLPHLNMGTELTWAPIYKGVCVCESQHMPGGCPRWQPWARAEASGGGKLSSGGVLGRRGELRLIEDWHGRGMILCFVFVPPSILPVSPQGK